jgi:hypothetical protein
MIAPMMARPASPARKFAVSRSPAAAELAEKAVIAIEADMMAAMNIRCMGIVLLGQFHLSPIKTTGR